MRFFSSKNGCMSCRILVCCFIVHFPLIYHSFNLCVITVSQLSEYQLAQSNSIRLFSECDSMMDVTNSLSSFVKPISSLFPFVYVLYVIYIYQRGKKNNFGEGIIFYFLFFSESSPKYFSLSLSQHISWNSQTVEMVQ